MKKSEILKILGDYVQSYRIETITGIKFLTVQVDCIHNYHLAELSKFIMNIRPVYFETGKEHLMEVVFANIIVD